MADTDEKTDPPPFIWKGRRLAAIGELLDATVALATREEAEAFMAAYRAVNEHADQNIGYIAGYCAPETMERILDWTGTGFGRMQAMSTFTKAMEEAIERG